MDERQRWDLFLERIQPATRRERARQEEALDLAKQIARSFKTVRCELANEETNWHRSLREAVERVHKGRKAVVSPKQHSHLTRNVLTMDRAGDALKELWEDPGEPRGEREPREPFGVGDLEPKATLDQRIAAFADAYETRPNEIGTRMGVISTLLMACGGNDHPPVYQAVMKWAYGETPYSQPRPSSTEAELYRHAREFLGTVVKKAHHKGLQRPRNRLEAWLMIKARRKAGAIQNRRNNRIHLGGAQESEETIRQNGSGSSATSEIKSDPGAGDTPSAVETGPPEHTGPGQRAAGAAQMSPKDFEKARCAAQKTGCRGEIMVDGHLRQLQDSGEIDGYEWVSKANAISPFDFRVQRADEWERLEVKSTREGFGRAYYLSAGELEAACDDSVTYRIARVYDLTSEGARMSARMRMSRPLRDYAKAIRAAFDDLPDLPEGVRIDTLKIDPTDDLFDEEDEEEVELSRPSDGQ